MHFGANYWQHDISPKLPTNIFMSLKPAKYRYSINMCRNIFEYTSHFTSSELGTFVFI